MDDKLVTITKEEYRNLLNDSRQLNHLVNNGVDNWEWYSHYSWDEDDEECNDQP